MYVIKHIRNMRGAWNLGEKMGFKKTNEKGITVVHSGGNKHINDRSKCGGEERTSYRS